MNRIDGQTPGISVDNEPFASKPKRRAKPEPREGEGFRSNDLDVRDASAASGAGSGIEAGAEGHEAEAAAPATARKVGEPESQLADVRTVRGGELSERLNGWRLWDECPPPLDEQVLLYSSEHKRFDTGCRTDFNGGGRVTRSMYGQWADYWHSLPAVPSASVPHIPGVHPSDGASPAVSGATRCSVSESRRNDE